VCAALGLVTVLYTVGAYRRTEVWCGKTTLWKGRPNPDLSLWTSAVETDPANVSALTNLALVYLRFNPPEAGQALALLHRALQLGEANQARIAGGSQLDLSRIYEALGDAYLAEAPGLASGRPGSDAWRQKKEAYAEAVEYFERAAPHPSGFAQGDARLFRRLAGACEGQAQMDVEELAGVTPGERAALVTERDALRSKSEESLRHAREILVAASVPSSDPEYRAVMLEQGNIIFGREVGASDEEKSGYYRQALPRYLDAAALFPDDPRPFLYAGLCYERLTGMAPSAEEKRKQFALGEAALRQALTLQITSPDYTPALPYHGLALLYAHMNDYPAVLEALKKEQQADPAYAESNHLSQEIQAVEQYLARQGKSH
jgi:tetratricopeptide (TPR) repeat protein